MAWVGFVAPAGTPKEIVDKLYNAIIAVLATKEMQEKLNALGAEAAPQTPAEFAAYMKDEVSRWQRVIREAKISIN